MMTIEPYLNFPGNCEEVFNHYKTVFGGEFLTFQRFSEMPPQEGFELPDAYREKIMHVSLRISEEAVLMGSDSGGEWAPEIITGNNIILSIGVDSKEQADDLFGKLSDGGKITMPLEQAFWGSYFGMCTDRFGINWMVSFGQSQKE